MDSTNMLQLFCNTFLQKIGLLYECHLKIKMLFLMLI